MLKLGTFNPGTFNQNLLINNKTVVGSKCNAGHVSIQPINSSEGGRFSFKVAHCCLFFRQAQNWGNGKHLSRGVPTPGRSIECSRGNGDEGEER